MTTQIRNADLVEILKPDFQARNESQFALANCISTYLALPGLRGFWPMSLITGNGHAIDGASQARTLTNTNTVTYDNDALIPYANFVRASSQYFTRADEFGLDILGTESEMANGGITFGGWFYLTDLLNNYELITKYNTTGNQRSYRLTYNSVSNIFRLILSNNGTAVSITDTTETIVAQTWYFVVGRLETSTEETLYVNDNTDTQGSGIASIFNSNADLNIGARNNGGVDYLNGRVSMCFLCVGALPDYMILNLYNQTRSLFGV